MNVGNLPALSGLEIKKLRGERAMSREQLAVQLGISPRSLERIEQGKVKVYPPLGKLARLVLGSIPSQAPSAVGEESNEMFSEDLIDVRRQMDLSRQEMAERMGIETSAIEEMEKERVPITVTVEKFATLMLEYHNLKAAQDLSKAELWRMLLEEREKNRGVKRHLEERGLI